MPFSKIFIRKGKSSAYLKTLSETLQDTMESTFNTPHGDCFQVIHQLEGAEFVYDKNYLGGPRSEDYVLIQITVGKPRSTETKKRFYLQLATNLHERLGLRVEDMMVVLNSSEPEDWSFSNGAMFTLKKTIRK